METIRCGESTIYTDSYTYGHNHIEVVLSGADIHIGKFCSIAVGVKAYLGQNHRTDWITTYPFGGRYFDRFNNIKETGFQTTKGNIVIENDVYIGIDAKLMSGVTISNGAVIGAHTVVTKNVPPYCIFAGNPGRVVKKRFRDEDIEFLLRIKWWYWSEAKINTYLPLLCNNNIEALKKSLT
ncbi:MAG: antibiotic acetyltransferase [Alphaproteobacteria bacterium]|nr:antibiotic acetyltransferase [Alphaproteobacteria bacterium]